MVKESCHIVIKYFDYEISDPFWACGTGKPWYWFIVL